MGEQAESRGDSGRRSQLFPGTVFLGSSACFLGEPRQDWQHPDAPCKGMGPGCCSLEKGTAPHSQVLNQALCCCSQTSCSSGEAARNAR